VEPKPRSWENRAAEIERDESVVCLAPSRAGPAIRRRGIWSAQTPGPADPLADCTCHPDTAGLLAEHAARLARRNEALEDFAGLLAHDVRAVLVAGLLSGATRESLTRGLELVDSILDVVQVDRDDGNAASVPDCVRQAVLDIGDPDIQIGIRATDRLPMEPNALRYVLRNLLANAVAAQADVIHISALACGDCHVLAIDDDGVGLDEPRQYASGAGLGLTLCRRVLSRFGGTLELRQGPVRGSRALIVLTGASR
jgi:signal transduction histidine kinase